jgi:hypothetical protein
MYILGTLVIMGVIYIIVSGVFGMIEARKVIKAVRVNSDHKKEK